MCTVTKRGYAVDLTDDASHDLVELYDYIALYDAPAKADYVLNEIEKLFIALSEMLTRGSYPEELLERRLVSALPFP